MLLARANRRARPTTPLASLPNNPRQKALSSRSSRLRPSVCSLRLPAKCSSSPSACCIKLAMLLWQTFQHQQTDHRFFGVVHSSACLSINGLAAARAFGQRHCLKRSHVPCERLLGILLRRMRCRLMLHAVNYLRLCIGMLLLPMRCRRPPVTPDSTPGRRWPLALLPVPAHMRRMRIRTGSRCVPGPTCKF